MLLAEDRRTDALMVTELIETFAFSRFRPGGHRLLMNGHSAAEQMGLVSNQPSVVIPSRDTEWAKPVPRHSVSSVT